MSKSSSSTQKHDTNWLDSRLGILSEVWCSGSGSDSVDHAANDFRDAIAELESTDVAKSLVAALPQYDYAAILEDIGKTDGTLSRDGAKFAALFAHAALQAFIDDPVKFRAGGFAKGGTESRIRALFPGLLPQPTFPEAKRLARGLALGPNGIGWSEIIGQFALLHVESGAEHNLRLEGGLIPEWWGKPSDNASLRRELDQTGHDGIAVLFNALGLVLHSNAGHIDVEIDDLIGRIGIDPRSKTERIEARLKVWRILTILGAVRVVGARRRDVRDKVSGKKVRLESDDPLLFVSPWKRSGTQETFDAGTAPLAVTIQATPWLDRWRGNRAALQDFGNLLAISEIPIGKPSGAWARAIGWALQQCWREQATHATYGRAGDDHRKTVRFQPFTRRQLLEIFPPKPPVQDVLKGTNPVRAIAYWDSAIADLRSRGVVSHYTGSRDWAKRPRKGWADLWLDESLDIRPSASGVEALLEIATSAKRKKKQKTDR